MFFSLYPALPSNDRRPHGGGASGPLRASHDGAAGEFDLTRVGEAASVCAVFFGIACIYAIRIEAGVRSGRHMGSLLRAVLVYLLLRPEC
jgi:hypothetical protein